MLFFWILPASIADADGNGRLRIAARLLVMFSFCSMPYVRSSTCFTAEKQTAVHLVTPREKEPYSN